tara:strand:- start:412 stop:1032 length:621 start_codon:yes stop_codon:yes gene_type:complete
MLSALFTGFFLGLSLIVAIGAQNAFVLRQGILKLHVFHIALFCSISDSILIILGVSGVSYFLDGFIQNNSKIIFGFAALWLLAYGLLRIRSALKVNTISIANNTKSSNLINAISIAAIFTFANPHVYLDTLVLIGSISQQFIGINRIYFAIGATSASFIWFFSLAYGAKFLSSIFQKPSYWRILDILIALIMFIIAFNLASLGGWF